MNDSRAQYSITITMVQNGAATCSGLLRDARFPNNSHSPHTEAVLGHPRNQVHFEAGTSYYNSHPTKQVWAATYAHLGSVPQEQMYLGRLCELLGTGTVNVAHSELMTRVCSSQTIGSLSKIADQHPPDGGSSLRDVP
jgi:hypothetical protein